MSVPCPECKDGVLRQQLSVFVGGRVCVMSLEEWHRCAITASFRGIFAKAVKELFAEAKAAQAGRQAGATEAPAQAGQVADQNRGKVVRDARERNFPGAYSWENMTQAERDTDNAIYDAVIKKYMEG